MFCFGSCDHPDTTLQKYCEERDDLQAGRIPQRLGGLTLSDMVNLYIAEADGKRNRGELSALSFRDFKSTGGKDGRVALPNWMLQN